MYLNIQNLEVEVMYKGDMIMMARDLGLAVLCLGQDFLGTQVSLYLNFRGTFTNSGGHTKSFNFLPVEILLK